MKKIAFCLFFLPVVVFSQGASKALNFDGTNDYVSVGAIGTFHTIEFWINSNNNIDGVSTAKPIMSFNGAVPDMYIWSNNAFGAVAGETITLGSAASGNQEKTYITNVLLPGWNHVAFVSNGTIFNKAYVNGVSVTASPYSFAAPNNLYALVFAISTLQIGARTDNGGGASAYFSGELDELRFWNTQRTQTQIRDYMCQRVPVNSSGLIGYYRFDNGAGTTLSDLQTNGSAHNGTANNFAMAGATSNWVTSGAAIGDTSIYNYPGAGGWAGITITLSTNTKGVFKVSSVGGTVAPTGMQMYRVDAVPSITTGITGLGTNNVYWGAFLSNAGTSPTYTAVLDYTNTNPYPSKESGMVLNNRTSNASTPWTDITATLNTTANTLTEAGITARKEFILSNTASPLPVELIDFNSECTNGNKTINWTTASERNNNYFTVERSSDAITWLPVKAVEGAGNSTEVHNYFIHDTLTIPSYYRLKQTDYDGNFKYSASIYSTCGNQHVSGLAVHPNPSNGLFHVNHIDANTTLQLLNSVGKIIASFQTSDAFINLNIPELQNGTYMLKAISPLGVKNCKLIITK